MHTFKYTNQLHTDDDYAVSCGFDSKIMQGAILNGFISHFIGMEFPNKNTVIQSVDIKFKRPSYLNDCLKLEAIVDQKSEAVKIVILKIAVMNVSQQYIAAKAKVQIGLLESKI